jgi:membrane associated rhomboid family serine protease
MQLSITLIIIIITVLVSIGAFNNHRIYDDLIFYPPAVTNRGQWYRFFTCGLIHADWPHLIFNMVALYGFGAVAEVNFGDPLLFGQWGKWLYLLLYVSALAVCLLPSYFKNRDNYHYRSLGASGGVSAVIFAALLLFPASGVGVIFVPSLSIPGFIFAPLYLIFSAYLDKKGNTNINHSAHIWGAFYGMAFIIVGGYLAGYSVITNFIIQVKAYFHVQA